jgi:hypothetical protein
LESSLGWLTYPIFQRWLSVLIHIFS